MKKNFFLASAIAIGIFSTLTFIVIGSALEQPQKDLVLKPQTDDRAPASYNKMRSPLSTSIQRLDVGGYNQIRLKGTVVARRDFQNLKIEWAIPEGVEIVSGNIESNTFDLASGQSASFEIVVSQKNGTNHQIYFQAQTTDAEEGENIGAVAEYNTTKQEVIAQQLRANFLKARERVKAGELRKIIF